MEYSVQEPITLLEECHIATSQNFSVLGQRHNERCPGANFAKKKYKLCVLNVLWCQARRLYFCVKQDLRTETFFWRFRTEIVWCCTSLLAAGMVFRSHVQICNGYFSSGLANLIGIISNGQARGSLCSLLYERSQQTKLHIRSDQAFKQCWKECRFTGK